MIKKLILSLLINFILIASCYAISLHTSSFGPKGGIPKFYTCFGKGLSPELDWSNIPVNTKSFALIVSDPDAPKAIYYHWIVYNIPKNILSLPEGITKLPPGVQQGKNSAGKNNYKAPCPPVGKPHRYIFTLYALDNDKILPNNLDAKQLLNLIQPHVIASITLIGTYQQII